MKSKLLVLVLSVIALVGCSEKPKILIAGSGWGEIVLLDKESKKIEWRHQLEKGTECNCVILTPDNNIAYSYRGGARKITPDQNVIWDYQLQQEGEIHTVAALEEGGYMLAASGKPARIIRLDENGKKLSEITFEGYSDDMHGQFRQVRRSRNGNYLIPSLAKSAVIEIDPTGREVRNYPVFSSPFSVMELPTDNLIVSCGDGHAFVEIDRNSGNVIKTTDQSGLSESDLLHYVAQIVRLDNENLMLCNWNGHFAPGQEKKVPHLIEFDQNGSIAWKLEDFTDIKRVSAVHYIRDGKSFVQP